MPFRSWQRLEGSNPYRFHSTQGFKPCWHPTTPVTSICGLFLQGASLQSIEPSGTSTCLEQSGRIELHSLRLGRPRTRHTLDCMVGMVRVKLTTSRLKDGCSNQLSYTPIKTIGAKSENRTLFRGLQNLCIASNAYLAW